MQLYYTPFLYIIALVYFVVAPCIDGFIFTKIHITSTSLLSTSSSEMISDEVLFSSLTNSRIGTIEDTSDSSIKPEDVIPLIMHSLNNNDIPNKDSGLKLVWGFSSEITKHIFKYNITEFIESCHETANEFPTSFYGIAMNGKSWEVETDINRVGGENGWIATQVMKSISSDGRMRRWQWEMRKNRRPPDLDCWRIENIASSDRNGDFSATDRGDGWSD